MQIIRDLSSWEGGSVYQWSPSIHCIGVLVKEQACFISVSGIGGLSSLAHGKMWDIPLEWEAELATSKELVSSKMLASPGNPPS